MISYIWNVFIIFLLSKLVKNKIKIFSETFFLIFLYTFIVGIGELFLIFLWLFLKLDEILYFILCGVIIFLTFKFFFLKKAKIAVKTNVLSLLMAILTNPLMGVLIIFLIGLIFLGSKIVQIP
ncbi:MAG: hypothetical protein QW140_02065 [Candidatus Aenigmatarchaeota archaeon]